MLHLEQVTRQDPTSATDDPSDAMPQVGYITVAVKDIVGYLSATDGDGATAGQSVIWIRSNAMPVLHESVLAPDHDTSQPVTTPKWPR
jgi:hypothetical protein